METSNLLSLLSLIVSLGTGLIVIYLMIRPNKYFLEINSSVDKTHSEVNIQIINKGLRPFNILAFTIGYGVIAIDQQIILQEKVDPQIKVMDGEFCEYNISRSKIVSAVYEKAIKQKHNQRLWIGVKLSNRKIIYKVTTVDSSIIKDSYLPNAINYIASDLFIGFNQMESKNELPIIPLTVNDLRQFKKDSAHNTKYGSQPVSGHLEK